MYDIEKLNNKKVAELREIAEKLNIQKSDKLKKQELVYKILDEQALKPNEPKATKKEDSSRENKVVASSNDNQKDSNLKQERTNPSSNQSDKQSSNHPRNNNNRGNRFR